MREALVRWSLDSGDFRVKGCVNYRFAGPDGREGTVVMPQEDDLVIDVENLVDVRDGVERTSSDGH